MPQRLGYQLNCKYHNLILTCQSHTFSFRKCALLSGRFPWFMAVVNSMTVHNCSALLTARAPPACSSGLETFTFVKVTTRQAPDKQPGSYMLPRQLEDTHKTESSQTGEMEILDSIAAWLFS